MSIIECEQANVYDLLSCSLSHLLMPMHQTSLPLSNIKRFALSLSFVCIYPVFYLSILRKFIFPPRISNGPCRLVDIWVLLMQGLSRQTTKSKGKKRIKFLSLCFFLVSILFVSDEFKCINCHVKFFSFISCIFFCPDEYFVLCGGSSVSQIRIIWHSFDEFPEHKIDKREIFSRIYKAVSVCDIRLFSPLFEWKFAIFIDVKNVFNVSWVVRVWRAHFSVQTTNF